MKRREFLGLGLTLGASGLLANVMIPSIGSAAGATITEKDILREGQKTSLANFCENPEKGNNKACPDWKKTKPGHCKECSFYNVDASETTYRGDKYAKCQLLQSQPQYVSGAHAYCATFNKKG